MWILIIFLTMGSNGGSAIYSVSFSSKQTCEAAQKVLPSPHLPQDYQNGNNSGSLNSICVQK